MQSFQELNIPEKIKASLLKMGFETPTPIQKKAIPVALEGRDLLASAQTGSGKTAAFCIPALTHVLAAPTERKALILAPTRELADQILSVIRDLLDIKAPSFQRSRFQRGPDRSRDKKSKGEEECPISVCLLIGGAPFSPQFKDLRHNPQIIVGTPGRIVDHLDRGSLQLDTADFFVLDECDRMLDMGFAPQLDFIMESLPEKRQTLLFSATLAPAIEKIAKKHLTEPLRLQVESKATPPAQILQTIVKTTAAEKEKVLVEELNKREGSAIIFAKTKLRTEILTAFLEDSGFQTRLIHGDRSQRQREQALRDFRNGKARILVATDIAARGIDVPHIRLVVNYELPQSPEDFIHRLGRTGRAGAEGECLSLVGREEMRSWRLIERILKGDEIDESERNRPMGRGGFAPRRGGGGRFGDRAGGGGSRGGPGYRSGGSRSSGESSSRGFAPRGDKGFSRREEQGDFFDSEGRSSSRKDQIFGESRPRRERTPDRGDRPFGDRTFSDRKDFSSAGAAPRSRGFGDRKESAEGSAPRGRGFAFRDGDQSSAPRRSRTPSSRPSGPSASMGSPGGGRRFKVRPS